MRSLKQLGSPDSSVIPDLIKAGINKNWEVRQIVLQHLEKMQPPWYRCETAASTIPYLIMGMTSKRVHVRESALTLLERIDPHWYRVASAKKTIPDLLQTILKPEMGDGRIGALEALKRIGTEKEEALTPLLRLLSDGRESDQLRVAAVEVLGTLGTEAKEAVPILERMNRYARYRPLRTALQSTLQKIK